MTPWLIDHWPVDVRRWSFSHLQLWFFLQPFLAKRVGSARSPDFAASTLTSTTPSLQTTMNAWHFAKELLSANISPIFHQSMDALLSLNVPTLPPPIAPTAWPESRVISLITTNLEIILMDQLIRMWSSPWAGLWGSGLLWWTTVELDGNKDRTRMLESLLRIRWLQMVQLGHHWQWIMRP